MREITAGTSKGVGRVARIDAFEVDFDAVCHFAGVDHNIEFAKRANDDSGRRAAQSCGRE
jgi:hypothetical protein